MMKHTVLFAAILAFTGAAHAGPAFEGADHSHVSLLVSPVSADVKLAGKALAHGSTHNPAVFDVAAEVLSRACQGRLSLDADTQSWLAIGVGKSRSSRYRGVLSSCVDHAAEASVQHDAHNALGGLDEGGSEPYVPGSIDLASVAGELAAAVRRDAANRPVGKFNTLTYRQSLDDVYGIMGLPDSVHATAMRTGDNAQQVYVSGLRASWKNAGALTFRLLRGARWQVGSIASAGVGGGEDPKVARARQFLGTADSRVLQSLAKDLIVQHETDHGVLDAVAARIGQSRSVQEPHWADSLAWLCKALGRSGEGRYKAFLLEIADTASSRRLRGHCEAAADALPDAAEPFSVAGFVPPRALPPEPVAERSVDLPEAGEPVEVVPVIDSAAAPASAAAAGSAPATPSDPPAAQ